MIPTTCSHCGAPLPDQTQGENTCDAYLHQMLFWEQETPILGVVHHLMVLCYHLQHPHHYSTAGLAHAKTLLKSFLAGESTETIRRRQREAVNSSKRRWTVTARAGDEGRYDPPVAWSYRAADVVAAGKEAYIASVRAWAAALQDDLHTSGHWE
ncbi:MAG TPA: DUF5946 family protein [Aggregatilineales bacterium]|nr:hypothetical protein [Anaerolineales bacterium]HRE47078.1 DUF5946 family protein [Aggregatilineales bacterium]